MSKFRNFAIANTRSGWGIVCFETTEYRGRIPAGQPGGGRYTHKVDTELICTMFRASKLEKACEKLAYLLRNSPNATVTAYLYNSKQVVRDMIRDAIPCKEVDVVDYVPENEIKDRSTAMGLAFYISREAYKDEVCAKQDHTYAYDLEPDAPLALQAV